jgi:hypothetical protein
MKYKGFKNDKGDFVNEVYFDGYHFGDRLLEDVIFKGIVRNGKLSVEITEDCAEYFSDLNQNKWLGAAKTFLEENGSDEYLTDKDGIICELIKND